MKNFLNITERLPAIAVEKLFPSIVKLYLLLLPATNILSPSLVVVCAAQFVVLASYFVTAAAAVVVCSKNKKVIRCEMLAKSRILICNKQHANDNWLEMLCCLTVQAFAADNNSIVVIIKNNEVKRT